MLGGMSRLLAAMPASGRFRVGSVATGRRAGPHPPHRVAVLDHRLEQGCGLGVGAAVAVGQRRGPAVGRGRVLKDRLGLGRVDDVVVGQREQDRLADGKRGKACGPGSQWSSCTLWGLRAGPSAGGTGVHRDGISGA